jgi:TIR domain
MPRVFLSYARSDAQVVERIARDLRGQGVDLWMDRQDLLAGQEWLPQIEKAISGADFMLVFISKASLNSKWVQREYQVAFQSQAKVGGTRLIPVLLERVDLPPFLSSIQYVDLTESYFEGVQQLLRALQMPVGPRPAEVVDPSKLAREVAGEVAKILGLESQPKPSESAQESNSNLVFVIMAFRDDMEPVFEGIREAGAALGLTAKRVKDVPGDYRITNQIVEMIRTARFVVADLSHERPNVYFELGYARGLGKTVITVAREGTSIHFDVKDWTYIPYIDSRLLERDIKKRFEFELSRRP